MYLVFLSVLWSRSPLPPAYDNPPSSWPVIYASLHRREGWRWVMYVSRCRQERLRCTACTPRWLLVMKRPRDATVVKQVLIAWYYTLGLVCNGKVFSLSYSVQSLACEHAFSSFSLLPSPPVFFLNLTLFGPSACAVPNVHVRKLTGDKIPNLIVLVLVPCCQCPVYASDRGFCRSHI